MEVTWIGGMQESEEQGIPGWDQREPQLLGYGVSLCLFLLSSQGCCSPGAQG